MKKTFMYVVPIVVLSIMLAVSCGGTPPPRPATPPPAQTDTQTTAPTQPGALILDGAGSYTTVSGDTLAEIAASRYGQANMYYFPLIRLANANVVSDPDVIEVGTRLVIPDLQRNLNNDGAKAAIRADMLSIAQQYERQSKPNAAATLRNMANRL